MDNVSLIFPHQLFEASKIIEAGHPVILIEEYLFFNQYAFHKQKLAFHRASMLFYQDYLRSKGITTRYVDSTDRLSDIRQLVPELSQKGVKKIIYIDPVDDWLSKRMINAASKSGINLVKYQSPLFLNTEPELSSFFRKDKKKFFQTSFYKLQRKSREILIEENGQPSGGKWTYDTENRKRYPKNKIPPPISYPANDRYYSEALNYVENNFPDNPGKLSAHPIYPHTFESSRAWFDQFLKLRFHEFGPYEDAIVKDYNILNHSVLTPSLNIGLIPPGEVIEKALEFGGNENVPINSLEGFIRQIIGWREFIRGIYITKGGEERTSNYWKFSRKLPASFYSGTTGILPVDETIKKVLATGYCHHIERLMVLGNFMLLCEFDPDEVYRWFMELFIDAYDWVMVPNVYGMSQFADGGLMSTKPYISSSNYLFKMGDYKKGEWQKIWDGLFWRFMNKNRQFFLSNPRLSMLIRTFDRMSEEKRENHLITASEFLTNLDAQILSR